MDLNSSAQEASDNFGDALLHEGEHSYGKSSHAFRTISEVSEEIDVPQHVLRFWESKFAQIRPLKRGGGRRYYRPEDIELLKRIKNFLYKQGYTIKGVQRLLKEKRSEAVSNFVPYASPAASLPGFPYGEALQQTLHPTGPLSISSYLQAAAAAPSALAMAYGSIGGQIAERAGEHHFGDAFEQSTVRINEQHIAEDQANNDQIEKTLVAVTQIHSELVTPVQPIRIANPAAPSLEDMTQDVVDAARDALLQKTKAQELEFNFDRPAPVDMLPLPQVHASAAQPAVEAFEEDEFNQDVADEEVPVRRLDDTATFEEDLIEQVREAQPLSEPVAQSTSVPAIAPEKKVQLLGVLAEMMALRDMLRVEIVA